jgi:hypothetical protein
MNRILLIMMLLPLAGLGGCSRAQKPEIPKVVYVKIEKPVALPESLTRPCPPARAKERTVEAVVSAYNANIPVQTDCDERMSRIRALQPNSHDPQE